MLLPPLYTVIRESISELVELERRQTESEPEDTQDTTLTPASDPTTAEAEMDQEYKPLQFHLKAVQVCAEGYLVAGEPTYCWYSDDGVNWVQIKLPFLMDIGNDVSGSRPLAYGFYAYPGSDEYVYAISKEGVRWGTRDGLKWFIDQPEATPSNSTVDVECRDVPQVDSIRSELNNMCYGGYDAEKQSKRTGSSGTGTIPSTCPRNQYQISTVYKDQYAHDSLSANSSKPKARPARHLSNPLTWEQRFRQ